MLIIIMKNYQSNFKMAFLPNFVFLLLKLASVILLKRQCALLEINTILSALEKSLPSSETLADENIQIHLLFGLPMNDLAEDLVLFLSSIYNLPSNCY